jgi:hypothetical protein
MKPAARSDLALRELDDEAIVYDFRRHKAHCLNRTALAVFRLCNGKRSHARIARELSRELGASCDHEVVRMALEQLDKAQLLTTPLAGRGIDLERRRVLRKLALTAGLSLALPAVWSILAPTPAYAASACFPSSACMGVGIPTGCCDHGGRAGVCSGGPGMCMGTSLQCHGQPCR